MVARSSTRSSFLAVSWEIGAEEGIRTLDPLLGKEVLYH